MPPNELVLLDQVLAERQERRSPPLPEDIAFELFAIEQVLRDTDLSDEEIAVGRVGGGDDGGLDGIYTFLGDELLDDDAEVISDASGVSAGTPLRLWLVQAKRDHSFGETPIDLAESSLRRFLSLTKPDEELRGLYSDAVVGRMNIFRQTWQNLATRRPMLEVRFSYVTRGDTATVNPKVEQKRAELEDLLRELLPGCEAHVELVGARELWSLVSTERTYTLELPFRDDATSEDSHAALVTLEDYLDFITDEDGRVRRHIFDWNVCDFQGNVEVNREIEKSLHMEELPDFWWLNNGVTILTSNVSRVGKKYVLDDVQIVNGLDLTP